MDAPDCIYWLAIRPPVWRCFVAFKTFVYALILFTISGQIFAQTSAGVNGTVTDSSGAVVSGADVTITNLDTGARRVATTGDDGLYQFPSLQSGRYSVTVQKTGFKQMTQDEL